MTTSSTPDRGRALLMSTAAASFVLSAALVAGPALAQNECGTPSGGSVTCTSAGNPYANGITYAPTTDLTVVTDNTVAATGPVTVNGAGAANVTANNSGSINTASTTAAGGISATSGTGDATITNSGSVSTSGPNVQGLFAATGGAGNVNITSTGSVSTTGAGSSGVFGITSGTGNVNISVANVNATGAQTAGVLAEAVGTGTTNVTVAQGATVSGGLDGVAMGAFPSTTVATETLNNNGTITGGVNSVYSFATSGAAIVNNMQGGTLVGPVTLNGGVPGGVGNTVNNDGTWNVFGTSTFGPNQSNNVLNNTGIINVAPGVSPATTVNFNNLSTFNNAGGVVDVSTRNSLNIDNSQFNGGQGSTLRVNANSRTGELVLGSTGTGTTRVVLADVPGTNPAMNFQGQTLVTGPSAGTGPSFGSFNFGAPGVRDQQAGFVDYRLVFNQANQNEASSYVLFGLPGPGVFEMLNAAYALQDFWRHSAFTLTQRQMSIRDSQIGQTPTRAEGWEFWAQPYGGEDYFKRPQTFNFGGFNFPGIGNHNDTVGLQIGADMLSHFGSGSGWGFLGIGGAGTGYWGFTAGVEQQTTHFPGDDANNIYSVGGNIGLYGGVNWGGFYANALGKVDFANTNFNFSSAGFSPTQTNKAYGARGEVGYRWPWMGFYVEPSARINAFWTDSINLFPAGAAFHFNDDDPVVEAQFGGRVGTTFNFGMFFPSQVNPFPGQFNIYFGAWYENQYDGSNRMNFTTFGGVNGPTSIELTQLQAGQFIHTEYGLETSDWYGGLKLFLKGTNDFSGDSVGGWSAQGGVRFSF